MLTLPVPSGGQGTCVHIHTHSTFLQTHTYEMRPPDRNEFNQTLANITKQFVN